MIRREKVMLIMYRVSSVHWLTDEQYNGLLRFFSGHRGTVDALAFFTSNTHAPLTLEEARGCLKRLKTVMKRTREVLGIRVGVNVLATMGHHEENLDGSLDEPWQRVVDQEGNECRGTYCPSDPRLQSYVRELYTLVAEAEPDFIWVDDDVRLAGHRPATFTCFCKRCITRFIQETGREFTRETLTAAFNDGATDACLDLRRRWLEHNCKVITKLLSIIEQTVHFAAPDLPIGFMTGDRFYEGYAFTRWAQALGGACEREVYWRPGGGFYWDDSLLGLVEKAHDVGRQVAALPKTVMVIQSELENFPYHRLKKCVHVTMLEAAAHMAAGATGIAFNVLSQHSEPLDEYQPFAEATAFTRPFFSALQRHLGRRPVLGVYPAWNEDLFIAKGWGESWFDSPSIMDTLRQQYVLAEIGLPVCYSPFGAYVTTFAGTTPLAFTEEELKEAFHDGVLLDVPAWYALDHRGFAGWTGVRPTAVIEHDAVEVFTDHPINGLYKGRQRDCRQSFWFKPAYSLEPVASGVQVLSEMSDYRGRPLGPCLTAYENEFGGRVVVAGYYPWFLIHNQSKSTQVKRICAWLSRDRLPVVVESFAKVVVWARGEPDEDPVIVVLNASLDQIPHLCLRVRSSAEDFEVLSLKGEHATLHSKRGADLSPNYRRIVIDNVTPWNIYLLTCLKG